MLEESGRKIQKTHNIMSDSADMVKSVIIDLKQSLHYLQKCILVPNFGYQYDFMHDRSLYFNTSIATCMCT